MTTQTRDDAPHRRPPAPPARPAPDRGLASAPLRPRPTHRPRHVGVPHLRPRGERDARSTGSSSWRCRRRSVRSDIHCVTTWSKYDNDWEGVRFRDLLALAKVLPEAKHVMFHSYGGYTTNVPLEELLGDVRHVRAHAQRPAARRPSTAARCEAWCRTSTSGRAPSGSAASSSSPATARASGRCTATTCTATRGPRSATAERAAARSSCVDTKKPGRDGRASRCPLPPWDWTVCRCTR